MQSITRPRPLLFLLTLLVMVLVVSCSGSDGSEGAKGDQGPQGLKGDSGAQEPTGKAGVAGAKGDVGPAGADGKNGSMLSSELDLIVQREVNSALNDRLVEPAPSSSSIPNHPQPIVWSSEVLAVADNALIVFLS